MFPSFVTLHSPFPPPGQFRGVSGLSPPFPTPSPPFSPQDNFGGSLGGVEAALRKHEAIESDIAAYGSRVRAVTAVAAELEAERYHDMSAIATRRDHVVSLWEELRAQVAARRERLRAHLELQRLLRDLEHLMGWMEEMEVGTALRGWGRLGSPRGTPPVTPPVSPGSPGAAAVAGFRAAPEPGGRFAADPRPGRRGRGGPGREGPECGGPGRALPRGGGR